MASYVPSVVGRINGARTVIWSVPEAASQTFLAGEFVCRTSGYLTVCGTDPALILGIALEDAHNSTAGAYNILVDVATEDTLIQMSVHSATPATNQIEQTDLGKAYEIEVASNVWTIDKDATTNTRVRIQKFVDAVGGGNDTQGRVLVTVLAANREVQ